MSLEESIKKRNDTAMESFVSLKGSFNPWFI